jgi:hypothetical protein
LFYRIYSGFVFFFRVRTVRAIGWKQHENTIYDKITEWFKVIGKVLQDLAILPENVYNMDEAGVMLSMLGSVKVLVGRDDLRDYRGAGVERTMVAAIECISADGMIFQHPSCVQIEDPLGPQAMNRTWIKCAVRDETAQVPLLVATF